MKNGSDMMCNRRSTKIMSSAYWIIYSNARGGEDPASHRDGGSCADEEQDEDDSDLDSMCQMLEPHLRPSTPDATSRFSLKIHQEHKQLVQEYLKVQTELAYVSRHRSELHESLNDEQRRQQQEILKLEDEKESLVKLYSNLRRQLEMMEANTPTAPNSHRAQDSDGWVLVPNTRARQ